MTARIKFLAIGAVVLSICVSLCAQPLKAGKNSVTVRGQQQDFYFYPAAGSGPHRKILFAPGDGGFRGFAITIAEDLAAGGFDVYGIGTRHYLQSFTGSAVLSTSDIASDFHQLAQMIRQGAHERVLLVGWSEGAGLGLAAAAAPENRDVFDGLVAIGVTEYNILAWRWKDMGAAITKSQPDEPTFKSADFISKVSPLPLFVIASTSDEYVTPDITRALFAAAREPKRLVVVNASDHKYGGNTGGFFRALREGLDWIQQQHR